MKTNLGLVEYAKRALSEKWGYCLGAFGNTMTDAFLTQKCNQAGHVGEYNTKHKEYLKGFMGGRVSDCYGLVKGFLWTDWPGEPSSALSLAVDPSASRQNTSGRAAIEPKYNAAQDRNQEGAYNAAKEKGPLSTIPEIPGLILWMNGHAGVYIGNGEFIECAGAPKGMIKGTIKNGVVTSGSRFTHWFKDTNIDYSGTDTKQTQAEIAIDAICRKCGFNSPDYWKNILKTVKFFDDFVIGIEIYL